LLHQVVTSRHSDLVGFSIGILIFGKFKKKHGILLNRKAV
jgi:hypothetical protein